MNSDTKILVNELEMLGLVPNGVATVKSQPLPFSAVPVEFLNRMGLRRSIAKRLVDVLGAKGETSLVSVEYTNPLPPPDWVIRTLPLSETPFCGSLALDSWGFLLTADQSFMAAFGRQLCVLRADREMLEEVVGMTLENACKKFCDFIRTRDDVEWDSPEVRDDFVRVARAHCGRFADGLTLSCEG